MRWVNLNTKPQMNECIHLNSLFLIIELLSWIGHKVFSNKLHKIKNQYAAILIKDFELAGLIWRNRRDRPFPGRAQFAVLSGGRPVQ